jgi:hypothetical protein
MIDFKDECEEQKPREDKILNNSYNTGNIDYESFTVPIKIDDGISSLYEDQLSDNLIDVRTEKSLDEDLYKLFKISSFYQKYKNLKRVDKGDMSKMYYCFKEELDKYKSYSGMQIFIRFAEFFQISYNQLYAEIGVLDKESLLKELSEKGKVKNKIKTRKLF